MQLKQSYISPVMDILETHFEKGILYGSPNGDGNETPVEDPIEDLL